MPCANGFLCDLHLHWLPLLRERPAISHCLHVRLRLHVHVHVHLRLCVYLYMVTDAAATDARRRMTAQLADCGGEDLIVNCDHCLRFLLHHLPLQHYSGREDSGEGSNCCCRAVADMPT